eukprot:15353799-Ditylum_brightwellii.AAC.2
MGPIEEVLRTKFFPALFGELDPGGQPELQELWRHSVKRASLGIPDPTKHVHHCHDTLVTCCDVLVIFILEKEDL